MLKFIQHLIDLNGALLAKAKSATTYEEALALYEAKEYTKALPLMKEAAELGSLPAMSVLGSMYLLGRGTSENGVEAQRWLKKAVDGGFEGAISVLGMAYATGSAGIKINIPLASQILTLAAENGEQQSARMLEMMNKGEGMFRNIKKAK
jgi:TPR repeat protein